MATKGARCALPPAGPWEGEGRDSGSLAWVERAFMEDRGWPWTWAVSSESWGAEWCPSGTSLVGPLPNHHDDNEFTLQWLPGKVAYVEVRRREACGLIEGG